MRSLAAMMPSSSVTAMFWGDMVNTMHNGGTTDYQRAYGGRAGRTDAALAMLDHSIGLVPWWYSDPKLDPKTVPITQFVQVSQVHWPT